MRRTGAERDELTRVALEASRCGARVLRRLGLPRPGGSARVKGLGDYVSDADTESEAAIVEFLRRETPEIPVLAEEEGGSLAETAWAVDPLDGTTNFLRSLPVVGVSVGLVEARTAVVGAVVAPFLDLEFVTAREAGVEVNGEPARIFESRAAIASIVATGFPFRDRSRLPRYDPVLRGALGHFEDLRRAGAASLDLAWTATGTYDGFFELGLGAWDVAGGAALVIAAGGVVTDWDGGDRWLETGNVLAGTPAVHRQLLELASR